MSSPSGVLGFRLVAGSLPYALTFDEPFPYRMEALPADLDEIPLPLQNLLLRCLAADPEERFPDVAAFLAQLRQMRELRARRRAGRKLSGLETGKSASAWKPAARAGALLGKVWQLSQPPGPKGQRGRRPRRPLLHGLAPPPVVGAGSGRGHRPPYLARASG